MGVIGSVEPTEVKALVERSCKAQDLPIRVSSDAVVSAVAALLGSSATTAPLAHQSRQMGSTRLGSSRQLGRLTSLGWGGALTGLLGIQLVYFVGGVLLLLAGAAGIAATNRPLHAPSLGGPLLR